ncbi:histidine phosphatase family protein [Caulobacter sp. 602-1]|uniref:SixA phosphatase family protein n=1 Tax=unclassified Caulobacter TaxID=2648921 RepID=UPI000F640C2A|nr:histidine phosphatase family protein [Caulobacter sp. 602-1]RRN65928.1 histidine phosphatase family protein [Caulobacter sp. 602-1]
MERLILMRHGKAERHAQSGGDFERALAESGRADAAVMGQVLAGAGVAPDLLLVSSARRTRETAERVAPNFPKARVEQLRDLYHADPEDVVQVIEAHAEGAATIMVVGHNPGLHELALRLAQQGEASPIQTNKLRGRFPTSTTVVFGWTDRGPVLEHLLYAHENGGAGGE